MSEEILVIHKIFYEISARFPDRVALQIKKDNLWQRFTYKEVNALSLRIANFLIGEGLKKGDYAVLSSENRPEWAIIYLGIMYAGISCVPIDPQLNPQEIKNLIVDSQAKIIFCSQGVFEAKIKQNIQDNLIKSIIIESIFSKVKDIAVGPATLPSVKAEDIASLIYTSGTTAQPKGVLLTHKNICSDFKGIDELNICLPSDNFLSLLPLHHTYAFMVTLIVPLFLGAKVTYFGLGFKSEQLSQIIKEAQITILVGVPQLFTLLHKAIFDKIKKVPSVLRPFLMPLIKNKVRLNLGKSLRLLVSGGARLEPGIARDLSKIVCKLIEGYGLTETSPVVTLNPPEKLRFGSVGKPIPGVQIKINNPDKSGIGEVLIKGPNVMQGYFQHPELTAQVIKEGWFYSGDLGYIDSRGYLFLTGREKEVIVLSSGKNIYPEELEMHFSASPFIKEICILSKREERFGSFVESLYAVVVPNLDYFRQKNEANIQGTIRWELENLSKNLPSYKHIMGFAVTKEELPRTALKKLKRYQVKKKYLEKETSPLETQEMALSPEDLQLLNKDATKKIMGYISQELNKPVQLDSHLEIDLGIDSLTRVELGLGLEALLKTKIPDEILYNVSTVRDVIMAVQGLMERNKGVAYESRDAPKTWDEILQESPADTVLKKIRITADFLDILVILLFKCVFSFIFRVFWLLRVKGKDHLPVRGPYLLTPNHASYLDAFAIFSSLPLRGALNIFFLGYSKIFKTPAISWATKIARLISIDSSTHLTEAMQAAAFILKHKKAVFIFPEGRRSIGANIGEFKKGTGILIKELDIPVVPAYIKGSHRAWPRNSRFPKFFPLKVIFGEPVSLKELTRREKEESALDDYEVIARRLREEVIKLKC